VSTLLGHWLVFFSLFLGQRPIFKGTSTAKVPVLFWKLEKNNKFTTSTPTFSLQKNHLALATSAVPDNNERQRHTEKLVSPDLKNSEKGQVIDLNDRSAHVAINSEAPPKRSAPVCE
jgi:hypothetical protein